MTGLGCERHRNKEVVASRHCHGPEDFPTCSVVTVGMLCITSCCTQVRIVFIQC